MGRPGEGGVRPGDGRGRAAAVLAVSLIAAGLALRLWVAAQPVERLIPVCLADDAFYYLRIAENVLAGRGPSFDGEVATNGFHPLWLLVSLAAVRLGGGAVGGAGLLLWLLAAIGCGNAIQLWRLARRQLGPIGGAWAAGFWSLSPLVLFTELMGVEAPLMILLVLTAALAYLPLREGDGAPLGAWMRLGGWVGLALLARTDAILFAAALAADVVLARWLPARHDAARFRRRAGEACAACGAALLTVAPWAIYSLARFGTVTQDSYRALIDLQRAVTALEGEMLAGVLRRELSKGFHDHFVWYLGLGDGPWPYVFAGTLVGAAIAARLAHGPGDAPPARGVLRLLLSWAALSWAFYVFWFWVQKQWYFLPVHIGLALGSAWLVAVLDSRLAGSRARLLAGAAVTAAAAALLAGFLWMGVAHWRSGFHPWQATYLQVAGELRAMREREPGLRAAAFNSGVLSAFSGLPVVNVDGVVNPEAARAARERRLLAYLRARGIDVLADHGPLISLHGELDGGGWRETFSLVRVYPSPTAAGDVVLLRLRPARRPPD